MSTKPVPKATAAVAADAAEISVAVAAAPPGGANRAGSFLDPKIPISSVAPASAAELVFCRTRHYPALLKVILANRPEGVTLFQHPHEPIHPSVIFSTRAAFGVGHVELLLHRNILHRFRSSVFRLY